MSLRKSDDVCFQSVRGHVKWLGGPDSARGPRVWHLCPTTTRSTWITLAVQWRQHLWDESRWAGMRTHVTGSEEMKTAHSTNYKDRIPKNKKMTFQDKYFFNIFSCDATTGLTFSQIVAQYVSSVSAKNETDKVKRRRVGEFCSSARDVAFWIIVKRRRKIVKTRFIPGVGDRYQDWPEISETWALFMRNETTQFKKHRKFFTHTNTHMHTQTQTHTHTHSDGCPTPSRGDN